MKQQPLRQIAVPIVDPVEDLKKILDAWDCRLSDENEDDNHIRKFVITPFGNTVSHEVRKSAYEGLDPDQVEIEIVRNLVTRVYNHLLAGPYPGEEPELPEEILGRTSETDAERLIDETPPKPVT